MRFVALLLLTGLSCAVPANSTPAKPEARRGFTHAEIAESDDITKSLRSSSFRPSKTRGPPEDSGFLTPYGKKTKTSSRIRVSPLPEAPKVEVAPQSSRGNRPLPRRRQSSRGRRPVSSSASAKQDTASSPTPTTTPQTNTPPIPPPAASPAIRRPPTFPRKIVRVSVPKPVDEDEKITTTEAASTVKASQKEAETSDNLLDAPKLVTNSESSRVKSPLVRGRKQIVKRIRINSAKQSSRTQPEVENEKIKPKTRQTVETKSVENDPRATRTRIGRPVAVAPSSSVATEPERKRSNIRLGGSRFSLPRGKSDVAKIEVTTFRPTSLPKRISLPVSLPKATTTATTTSAPTTTAQTTTTTTTTTQAPSVTPSRSKKEQSHSFPAIRSSRFDLADRSNQRSLRPVGKVPSRGKSIDLQSAGTFEQKHFNKQKSTSKVRNIFSNNKGPVMTNDGFIVNSVAVPTRMANLVPPILLQDDATTLGFFDLDSLDPFLFESKRISSKPSTFSASLPQSNHAASTPVRTTAPRRPPAPVAHKPASRSNRPSGPSRPVSILTQETSGSIAQPSIALPENSNIAILSKPSFKPFAERSRFGSLNVQNIPEVKVVEEEPSNPRDLPRISKTFEAINTKEVQLSSSSIATSPPKTTEEQLEAFSPNSQQNRLRISQARRTGNRPATTDLEDSPKTRQPLSEQNSNAAITRQGNPRSRTNQSRRRLVKNRRPVSQPTKQVRPSSIVSEPSAKVEASPGIALPRFRIVSPGSPQVPDNTENNKNKPESGNISVPGLRIKPVLKSEDAEETPIRISLPIIPSTLRDHKLVPVAGEQLKTNAESLSVENIKSPEEARKIVVPIDLSTITTGAKHPEPSDKIVVNVDTPTNARQRTRIRPISRIRPQPIRTAVKRVSEEKQTSQTSTGVALPIIQEALALAARDKEDPSKNSNQPARIANRRRIQRPSRFRVIPAPAEETSAVSVTSELSKTSFRLAPKTSSANNAKSEDRRPQPSEFSIKSKSSFEVDDSKPRIVVPVIIPSPISKTDAIETSPLDESDSLVLTLSPKIPPTSRASDSPLSKSSSLPIIEPVKVSVEPSSAAQNSPVSRSSAADGIQAPRRSRGRTTTQRQPTERQSSPVTSRRRGVSSRGRAIA